MQLIETYKKEPFSTAASRLILAGTTAKAVFGSRVAREKTRKDQGGFERVLRSGPRL
jgi:hypothetical protein